MSNAKHTPGPWSYWYEGGGDFIIYADKTEIAHFKEEFSDDNEVVTVSGPDSCMMGGERSEANAHLIAAAPELYEALEEVLNTAGGIGEDDRARARAALKKARGES